MNINRSNIKLTLIIGIMVTAVLGATYAFLQLESSNSTASGEAGCFKVNYNSEVLSSSDLVSTINYLEGSHSQITLSKDTNCKIYTEATIYVHTNTTTTAPLADTQALKYKVLLNGTEKATGVINSINSDIELTTVELTNTPTTYDIYIWVDKDISQGAYNGKSYSGYIYATSTQSSSIKN